MEGIYVGKITRSKVDKGSADLLFIDHRQDVSHLDSLIKYDDTAYCLVPTDDIIINNDELLRLRDEVKQLTDECDDWKVRYSTVNNELFQKGLAYSTLETTYKNEKIAGEMLLKDRDALKEKVEKLEAELMEIKTARTLREAYISGVEKGCEGLREERDRWKSRWNSVVTDIGESLKANGITFVLKEIPGDGNWDVVIDIPELNEAKKKVEGLEKKLAAAKSNETYWRDRKEEEEDYHHYWLHTFDRAVKKAAEKGIHIGVRGNDDECNAGIVTLDNMKAEELEKRVVALEKTNNNLNQKIGAADNALEYWNNTYNDIVIAGKKVGVNIDIKGKRPDSNAGFVYVTNQKALELLWQNNYDKKWQAMLDALKEKGVEVIYMGEEDGKPIIEVKVPNLDELQKESDARAYQIDILRKDFEDLNVKYINRGSKIECLELDLKDSKNKDNKYEKLFIEATNMKDYWYSTYYEAVRQSWNQGVSIRIDRANLKDNVGIVQVNNERAEELKKELEDLKSKKVAEVRYELEPNSFTIVCTMCDGSKQTTGMDLSWPIDATSISCGTVPKCSSCAHYMHNPSRFAHDWCYMPMPKEGGSGYIRKLSTEEAEGPACSDFKARKE